MPYKIPKEVKRVYDQLVKADFEAFLVGGCVRDLLLNREPKDWDITTNAAPEQIQKIFPDSVYENKFGTVLVKLRPQNNAETNAEGRGKIQRNSAFNRRESALNVVEITTFRLEGKYSDKRHPDEVKFSKKLEDDLKRRDFTINAIALQIANRKSQIVDPFDGQKDLKNKTIRTVGNPKERFEEDALRLMRAVRLAAELDFEIEKKTAQAIKEKSGLLQMIAKERVRDELEKIIMSKNPKQGIEMLREFGLLKYIMPELEEGYGVTQNKMHVYTVWEHSLRALTHAADNKFPLDVRVAALLHDVGKPRTKRGEGPDSTFYNHEVVGAKMVIKILERLKFSKKFTEKVAKLVRWHLFFSDTNVITLSAVRRIIRNVGEENIWDLMKVRYCDRVGMGRPKERPFRLRKYQAMVEQALRDPLSVKQLKIDGEDVMRTCSIKPSIKVGQVLHILLEEVLDDPGLNTKEYLKKRARQLCQMADKDLAELGKKAKQKKETLEQKEVEKIHKRYFVK